MHSQRPTLCHRNHPSAVLAIALTLGLVLLGGTRAFDAMRAASYFLRTRKGPAVSIVRLDQEINSIKDHRYVFVRAGSI